MNLGLPVRRGRARARTLGAVVDVNADFNAALNSELAQLSTTGRAQLTAATGINPSAQQLAGAAATYDLATSGYNPDNPADNAKLVHAISAGLAAAPPPGQLLAGAVEVLWTVGNAVACPVTHFFGGHDPGCGDPPCTTSGNWKPSAVLRASMLPGMLPGSFAEFACNALAVQAANALNCKAALTPSYVVDAVVNVWNATHAGPRVPVFVPSLMPNWLPIFDESAEGQQLIPSAFWPIAIASPLVQAWYASGNLAYLYPAFGRGGLSAFQPSAPRVVWVNGGALLPRPQKVVNLHVGVPRAAASSSSGGGGAAVGVAAAGGAAAILWWLAENGWKWVTPRWAKSLVR